MAQRKRGSFRRSRTKAELELRAQIDERTFLVDPTDPDNPTVTFAEFDGAGRPRVLYVMLWGLPRVGE